MISCWKDPIVYRVLFFSFTNWK